ncbi:hypothetical protein pb186bvf_015635 [Paramecium bursaria]
MDQEQLIPAIKRIKERYVFEAMEMVERWRNIYETRYIENGRIVKFTLDQAAEQVGVPRKTLEDYYYQLKRAEKLVDLQSYRDCKMGVIRKIVKDSKKPIEIYDTNQFINDVIEYRKNSFDD